LDKPAMCHLFSSTSDTADIAATPRAGISSIVTAPVMGTQTIDDLQRAIQARIAAAGFAQGATGSSAAMRATDTSAVAQSLSVPPADKPGRLSASLCSIPAEQPSPRALKQSPQFAKTPCLGAILQAPGEALLIDKRNGEARHCSSFIAAGPEDSSLHTPSHSPRFAERSLGSPKRSSPAQSPGFAAAPSLGCSAQSK